MFRLGNGRYHNEWKNRQDVFNDFFPEDREIGTGPFENNAEDMKTFPEDSAILFASYEAGGYSGDALLLFVREGQLYLVEASHCSCNGLEECYQPEPTSWVQLWQHTTIDEEHGQQAIAAWRALVGHNVTCKVQIVGEDDDGYFAVTRHLSGSGKVYMLVPIEFIQQEQQEKG